MEEKLSHLEERIHNLELMCEKVNLNMELLDLKATIQFQIETVEALKAIDKELQDNKLYTIKTVDELKKVAKDDKEEADKRTTKTIAILALIFTGLQLILTYWRNK